MSNALRELFGYFDFQVAPEGVAKANKQFDQVASKIESIGTLIAGAFAVSAVESFFRSSIDLGSSINDTAEKLGLGTDELQEFQFAAKLSGVEAQEAAQSLGHLQKSIGEATQGGEAAGKFAAIGVAIKDTNGHTRETIDVLGDLADHFQATDDPAAKTALAMSLLGRSGTALIPILNQGGAKMRELFKQAHDSGAILGKDFIDAADKAGDQIDIFKLSLEGLKSRVVLGFLPAITETVATLTGWAATLGDVVDNSNLAQAAMYVLAGIGTYMAVTWALANIEFVLLAIALLAIWLVVDDLITLFGGGKSVIGDFTDSMLGVGASAAYVDIAKRAWEALGIELDKLKPIFKQMSDDLSSLGIDLGDTFDGDSALEGFAGRMQAIVAIVHALGDALRVVSAILHSITEGINVVTAATGSILKDVGGNVAGDLAKSGSPVQAITDTITAADRGGSIPNINQQNTTQILVQGAQDPVAVGNSVANKLEDVLLGQHRKALAAVK